MCETNIDSCKMWAHRIGGIILAILAICLSVFLVLEARNLIKAYNYIGKSEQTPNVVTISAEGKVTAVPNVATVQIGTTTLRPTVADAQAENTKKMNDIIAAVKKEGIADKDIKTSDYSIYPQYDWNGNKNVLSGYNVNQTLTLKIRDTKKINAILKLAGEKGANSISNLNFEIDDQDALKEQAREKAIVNAKEKAEKLAKSLGVKLDKIISFSESTDVPIYSGYSKYAEGAGIGGGGASPNIQTGENEIKVFVNITYEIL
ncbi:SIMPL domain-containing protein [Candidatus Falkowbacteria bacterium]|nr:SIMPL domain-containing protein [Candidatus Falkowbacteria bacterium]